MERYSKNACGVYDVIVVSGGDGTINEVINAIKTEDFDVHKVDKFVDENFDYLDGHSSDRFIDRFILKQ